MFQWVLEGERLLLLLLLLLLVELEMRLTSDGRRGPRYDPEEVDDEEDEEQEAEERVMEDVDSGDAGGELLHKMIKNSQMHRPSKTSKH
jgi:hypothetical protein